MFAKCLGPKSLSIFILLINLATSSGILNAVLSNIEDALEGIIFSSIVSFAFSLNNCNIGLLYGLAIIV